AAKDIAAHAVLLPDGFRLSPAKTRRDWTDEAVARLRAAYAPYPADGKLPFRPYLAASIRHRPELETGQTTVQAVASQERLNRKYFEVLWQTLNDREPSFPLDRVRTPWRLAKPQDAEAVAAEISAWQTALWKVVPIGSYRYGNKVRQVANDPAVAETQTL